MPNELIDPDKDFASFYADGGDPDATCERLYQWHLSIWGREVSGVAPFTVEVGWSGRYQLDLIAGHGVSIRLGSDGIIHTYSSASWLPRFSSDIAEEIGRDADDFFRMASTIGGYTLFPRHAGSINQRRGTDAAIMDRFDLTLECIRRHYDEPASWSPLKDCLAGDDEFFDLFDSFESYVRFNLFEDLVTPAFDAVHSLITGAPIRDFETPPLPSTVHEYVEYRRRSLAFVKARNVRIVGLGQ